MSLESDQDKKLFISLFPAFDAVMQGKMTKEQFFDVAEEAFYSVANATTEREKVQVLKDGRKCQFLSAVKIGDDIWQMMSGRPADLAFMLTKILGGITSPMFDFILMTMPLIMRARKAQGFKDEFGAAILAGQVPGEEPPAPTAPGSDTEQ